MIEYVITSEDVLEDIDEGDDGEEQAMNLREKIRYYEQKVLQTESDRLQKEKENLQLKESISHLRRQLIEKEKELNRFAPHTDASQRAVIIDCSIVGRIA